ncbi:MAG: hypothetical protein ABIJ36_02665 [Patescibacteria group bacterium]
MKLCEVYGVRTSADIKWVVAAENGNGQPEVIVVGNKEAISFACKMLGCEKTVGMGSFALGDFLEMTRRHELLRKVKSWEPFGL